MNLRNENGEKLEKKCDEREKFLSLNGSREEKEKEKGKEIQKTLIKE